LLEWGVARRSPASERPTFSPTNAALASAGDPPHSLKAGWTPWPTGQTPRNSGLPAKPKYRLPNIFRQHPATLGPLEVIHFIGVICNPTQGGSNGTGAQAGRGYMSDFARGVIGVLAVGMIAGVGALLLIPQPSPSAMRFSEPPARSCSQQAWPATDRICQKWTAPRRSDAHGTADAPPPSANAQPAVQAQPGSSRSGGRRR